MQMLEIGRAEGRIIVTADLDYPRLIALLKADGPAVILFRGGSYSDQEMLGLLDRALAQGQDLERSITVVDSLRIRRRRLPITD
jgi:predicted nuclease of predicted toxin-antitoxin system